MPLEPITFEVQRRINQPDDHVRKALSHPAELVAGMTTALGDDGLLVLEAPFRPGSFPYQDTLQAPAVLTSIRGRRVALVRMEISAWSNEATAFSLRPIAGRPERWSARRVEQFFTLAHAAADTVMRIICDEVVYTMGADHDIS